MTTPWENLKKHMEVKSFTYKEIENKVVFPVFCLGSDNCDYHDGILRIDNLVLDDRNMSGDTLGKRRLQTHLLSKYKLNRKVDDFISLLKQSTKYFIDTKGVVFIYEKTKNVPLKYLPIKNIEKKGTGCLLYLYSYKPGLIIPRPPPDNIKYVGVLFIEKYPWRPYDYSEEKLKNTMRKI